MITYRLEKGSPLSILEIDNNFRNLDQRLTDLEEHPTVPTISIEQQEDVLIFKVNQETVSHIVLPKFQPMFKGLWQKNTPYQPGCWVSYNRRLYACQSFHTTSETFDLSFWQLIFDGEIDA